MKNSTLSAMAVAFLALLSANSASAVTFKLMGSVTRVQNELAPVTPSFTAWSPQFSIGGGAAFEIRHGRLGFELGVNSLKDSIAFDLTGLGAAKLYWSYLQIPAMLRYHATTWLSVGVGGFYNLNQGKLHLDAGGVNSEITFDDPASSFPIRKTAYGAVVSLAMDVPVRGAFGIISDFRYTQGLREVSLDTANSYSWKPTGLQAFVGFRLGGGSK